MENYQTTPEKFNDGIGGLSPEQISKLLVACQNAIKEQYPVAGSKNIFNKVHTKGEYGAYRLTIPQLVDAGWLGPNAVEYINNRIIDHPEGPERLENRKSYFENAKEVFGQQLDFADANIESKNSAQYYFITTILEGISTKNNIKTASEILFSESFQDSIAYDYLKFIYNLLTAARVVSTQTDDRVVAGLLSVAICVNYDTALSYSRGTIKVDTNGVSSKYWYDNGWNSIADTPLRISTPRPNVPETPTVEGGATSTEKVIDKIRIEYRASGSNISGQILYDGIVIARSNPVSIQSISNQLDRAIRAARILGSDDKYLALNSARQQIVSSFDSDIAPIKRQLNIIDPTITRKFDSLGNTVITTLRTNPDGTKTTVVETISSDGTRTKETTQEKVILETNPEVPDLTDPAPTEVPSAALDENVNTVNSIDTQRANNQPLNTDVLPPEQQDDTKGFQDPNRVYPHRSSVNRPDTNPLATGVNSEGVAPNPNTPAGDRETLSAGASPLARNATRRREVPTAGRNGSTWSQPKSPYAAQYPYNKVFGSEAGHAIEIDDTPGAERLNWAHRSGTFDEIGPDGTKVTKITGDGYTILDKNGFIYIEGIANVHVAGNCNVIIMSDTNLTMHGRVSVDVHNDIDVNIAGRLALSVGEGIFARNGGSMSLENIGDIDIDAKGNFTTDVNGQFNLTSDAGVNMTSNADTHIKSSGGFYNHSAGDMNMCTDAGIKVKSAAATDIKSGAAVNVEGAGNINLKAPLVASSPIDTPTLDVTTANITTLNAGSTNLRATGTDTGTNGGSTHDLPISGPTSASVTEPTAAAEAECAVAAPLSSVKTVEAPVSRSVGGNVQMTGGRSTIPDNTAFDTEEESTESSAACRNGVGADDSGQVSSDDGGGTSDPSSDGGSDVTANRGSTSAPTTCNVFFKSRQPMPPLAMSGRLTDNIRLSDNYILRDMVKTAYGTQREVSDIRDYKRNGRVVYTKWEIVQNYRCMFLNVIEPLRERYPGFVINSGWRPTNSAHGYAAVDLQWRNYMSDRRKMIEIATWIVNNFSTDQVLLERGSQSSNTAWIHIGYKYWNGQQRNQYFTAQGSPWRNLSRSTKRFVNY